MHPLSRWLAAAASVTLLAAGACSGPAATEVAYVAVGGNNHVAVVDLDGGAVVRKLYTGASPWRLALSPDGDRLWIENWYAGNTAVVDLDDHRVAGTVPFRGPGTFVRRPAEEGSATEGAGKGDWSWLTADWPGRTLTAVDPRSLAVGEAQDSEIKEIYDLAAFGDDGRLLMAQYDPMARGPAPRYGYALSYRWQPGAEEATAPVSHPVGVSPVKVVPVPGQPFFLTADVGTDGIHLVNELGDTRSLAVCPAPRDVALSSAGDRLAVLCWRGRGAPRSHLVLFAADFAARPWPSLERLAEVEIPGALVAADFTAEGRLLAVDQTGGRLLVLAGDDLAVDSEIAVGDHPTDVVAATLTADRLGRAAEPPPERRRLLAALERTAQRGAPFTQLSWTETATWLEPAAREPAEGDEDGGEETAAEGEPVERHRSLRMALAAPDDLRSEGEDGSVRLAAGGWVVTLDPAHRFWVTPRQEMLATVLALPSLAPEEALRRLAGDVAGRPFLSAGLAVDVGSEVEDAAGRFLVVGAGPEGARVSQLWLDLDSGLPANLVEAFPVFGGGGHSGEPPGVVETKLEEYRPLAADDGGGGNGGPLLPARLERVVEGTWQQQVRLDDAVADAGLPALAFDAARLGGAEPTPDLFAVGALDPRPAADDGRPGRPVPLQRMGAAIGGPLAPFPPYASSPPTSGAYLPWAADAGLHGVPVPLPLQAHNLLDGGVALQYDCPEGCPQLVAELATVAARHDGVLVAPYPWLPDGSRLALTAWGRLELLPGFDRAAVESFVEAWSSGDHHAELPGGGGLVGAH